MSPSTGLGAAANNRGLVDDLGRIILPHAGKSEYSPQPQDQEGPCDRADNDTRNPTAGDCAWAVIVA